VPRHGAHNHQRVASARTDEGTTTTFTVRLPRWPFLVRLWGRDPLVRTTDRVDAVILALAVVVSVLAVPIAAAAGTAVHDARRDHYAAQAADRSVVVATVTEVPTFSDGPPIGATTVQARWAAGGREYTGALAAPATAQIGDPVEIWVDNTNGAWVPEPASTTRAAFEAVTAGLLIWVGAAGSAVTLFVITRAACNRIRFARWQLGLDDLGGDGDGSTRVTGER
jgi:hypothetical protein